MLLATLAATALGADVTRMPRQMGALVRVGYDGGQWSTPLLEQGQAIATRTDRWHRVDLSAAFAPTEGLALTAALELAPSWSIDFQDPRRMALEPVDGGGTYLGSAETTDPVTVRGGGISGLWLGAAVAPFSERYDRRHRITWRLDLALRPGSAGRNRWLERESGTRGAAPGGTGLRIAGAFSRRAGVAEPYLSVRYQREGRVTVAVPEAGLEGLALHPASVTRLRAGVEVHSSAQDEVTIDLFVGASYAAPARVVSGMYLPNTLDVAKTVAVTQADQLTGHGGLGFRVALGDLLQLTAAGGARYTVAHTPEHLFPVTTSPDAIGFFWQGGLIGTFGGPVDDG